MRAEVKSLIREIKPSVIYNLAAYGAYSSQTDVDRIYRVNFESVRYLLDEVSQLSGFLGFVQAGTSSEYGLNCSAPSEDAPTRPDSHYAVAKQAATALTQFYALKHDVPAWVFRLYSVYGPYEDTSRLILKLLIHASKGSLPPLVDPQISRDFIYLEDVCRAFESIIEQKDRVKKGEIYNIGSGTKTTLGDLIQMTCEAFQLSTKPSWGSMDARRWDHPEWYSNSSKASKELNWHPKIPLIEGLNMTMKWIRDHLELIQIAEKNSVLK